MLRGFFGNLIFAIIARMLCGNHLNFYGTFPRMENQGDETSEAKLEDDEIVPVEPEVAEQQSSVEQPAAVTTAQQPLKTTSLTTAAKDKKMMTLDERMTEFRDMLLERSVSFK